MRLDAKKIRQGRSYWQVGTYRPGELTDYPNDYVVSLCRVRADRVNVNGDNIGYTSEFVSRYRNTTNVSLFLFTLFCCDSKRIAKRAALHIRGNLLDYQVARYIAPRPQVISFDGWTTTSNGQPVRIRNAFG